MFRPPRPPQSSWLVLAVTTILSIQLLVLMEWVFFVTKPSFLAVLGTGSRLLVLGLTPLPFLVFFAGFLIPLALATRLLRPWPGPARFARRSGILVPSFVLGILFVLMADNFANTMWGWSIESSKGFGRIAGMALVMSAFVLGLFTTCRWLWFFTSRPLLGVGLASCCLVASLVSMVVAGGGRAYTLELDPAEIENLMDPPPNILLLGGDGLSSTHLSTYGYERATTPYLEELIPFSLFCENSFANCDHTTGSLASILTGRLPTETRVTYPPDILGKDQAYRHLPGLLKHLGYFTEQISIRHYGDAFDVNMREGFERAAFRNSGTAQGSPRFIGLVGQEAGLFFETIADRIRVRLAHAAGLGTLPSAFKEAARADRLTEHTDSDRFNGLVASLRDAPEPFFVHTHFMATHGTHFTPSTQYFSAGQTQDQDWMLDFYDDAILEFDGAVAALVEVLRERGILDNTLIIIYSDHGMRSDARHRTPLMFVFPKGDRSGRITTNVQNLDIAPTIVDYLGLTVPTWMHGRSLLGDPTSDPKPVFSTGFCRDALRRVVPRGPFEVDTTAAGPPFFSMGSLSMIVGQRVYSLDLVKPELGFHDLTDHTAPSPEADLPTIGTAGRLLVDHLQESGWDITGLPDPLPITASR